MRGEIFLQGLIGFLIVAFGQPSFAPWLGPISAILGYALFWRAIRIYPFRKQRFWRGAVWYASVSLIQLSWMSSIEYQGLYILFVWVTICLCLGVQFGLLSLLIPYNRPLTFPRILAIASLWTLLEWSRFHFLCGYSWNLSGLALSHPLAIQMATIFGVLGLSFWVIFVNLMGVRAFFYKRIPHFFLWGAAACVPYVFGALHTSYHKIQKEKIENRQELSCLLVQTGLLPSEKIPLQRKIQSFISPYNQWKRILGFLKDQRQNHPDYIVFPEAAVPFASEECVYSREKVKEIFYEFFGDVGEEIFPKEESDKVSNLFWAQAIANLFESEVIIGLDYVDEQGKSYNSAFHMQPHQEQRQRYDKRVLMPLAEYLPLSWLAPLVKRYGIKEFFTPGAKAQLIQGRVPLSISICYEETFPKNVREGRVAGAQLLVNITNDGWYPFSRLPSQHFEHAKFRAVENGTTLIRACNTGVSAVIDSLGHTMGKLEECDQKKDMQAGVLFTKFNLYEYSTLYVFWGNWGIVTISCVFLGLFVVLRKTLCW